MGRTHDRESSQDRKTARPAGGWTPRTRLLFLIVAVTVLWGLVALAIVAWLM